MSGERREQDAEALPLASSAGQRAPGGFGDVVLLVRVDSDGAFRLETANAAGLALFGVNADQALGAPLSALLPPGGGVVVTLLRTVAMGDVLPTRRVALVAPDGGLRAFDLHLEAVFDSDGAAPRVLVVFRCAPDDDDQQSSEEIGSVIASSSAGLFRTETGLGNVFVNERLLEILGLGHEAALGYGWLEVVHPDDRPGLDAYLTAAQGAPDAAELSFRIIRGGTDERWIRVRAIPLRGDDGAVTGFVGSLEDITDKIAVERAAARLHEFANAAQEFIGIADANWRVLYLNPSVREKLGIALDEDVSAHRALDFFPPGTRDHLAVEILDKLAADGRWSGEGTLLTRDGHEMTVECTVVAHANADGTIEHYSFLGRDVTGLRAMERAWRESEDRFRMLAESSPIGVYSIAMDGTLTYANPRLAEILGRPLHELLVAHVLADVHPDDMEGVYAEGVAATAEQRESTQVFRVCRPTGDERWLRTRAAPMIDENGEVIGFVGTAVDITAERASQQTLRRLERAVEDTTDIVTFHDTEGNMFFANGAAREFFELAPDDSVPRLGPADFIRATDEQFMEIGEALQRDGRWVGELDTIGANGRVMPASIVVVAHRDERGEVEYYSARTRDIGERRKIEALLADNEARFRSLVQQAPDLLAVVAEGGHITYLSPSVERLLGFGVSELVGEHFSRVVVEAERAALDEVVSDLLAHSGTVANWEGRLRHSDGTERTFETTLTNLLDDPGVRGIVVNARDVTERRDAEAARRRSEGALRAIVQSSPLAIFALDERGIVHLWNRASEHMFGWTTDEAVGYRPLFIVPGFEAEFDEQRARVFDGETIWGHEACQVRKDGTPIDVSVSIAPLRDASGRVVTAVAVVGDITEQKRARAALHESEVRFRSLVAHSTDMVGILDRDGCITWASPSACEFLGLALDDAIGRQSVVRPVPEDMERANAFLSDLTAHPGATNRTTLRTLRGDDLRWVEVVATNLLDDPAVAGIVINARDITERVDAEAAVRASEERLSALVASASDVISILEPDGRLRYSSPVAERILGYPAGAGYGDDIFSIIHPDDLSGILDQWSRSMSLPGLYRPVEVRLQKADGTWMYAEVVANNLVDDPAVRGIVLTTRDVTERKVAEEALRDSELRLRESEARYRAVVDDQTELVCRYLPDTTLLFANRAFAEFYGRSLTELIGSKLVDLFAPAERAREEQRLRTFGRGNEVQTQEDWEIAGDGSVRWYQWTDRAFLDEHGEVIEFQSVGRDVTERRRSALLTAHQAEVLEQVARGVPLEETLSTIARTVEDHFPRLACSILLLDPDGVTLRYGAAPSLPTKFLESIDGLRVGPHSASSGAAAHRGQPVYSADIAQDPAWAGWREVALEHGVHAAWSTPILASDGKRVLGTLDVFAREPRTPEAEHRQLTSLLAHLASIAIERKAFEERLAHQSMHDPLTGLPNRLLFLDRLGLSVARCRRTQSQVAVLFLDLDRFKVVNDSLGHDAGDELLVSVARRLESVLRPGDTVARFGGDEFTVLCEDLPASEARERASEIAGRLFTSVTAPFSVRGSETYVSASIGIALATSGEERPEELLRDADAAMYHAKEVGRNRIEVFDDTMRARALARHATENALHRALERGEFRLFFQPIVSLAEGRCVGAEALVRWQHPERGLVAPVEFIPLAEETGLIVELGAWVLEEAARQAARWQVEHPDEFWVSVNLSARQLAQPDLAERVGLVLERTGVKPGNLCLEITESVLMDDAETVIMLIDRVRALGVRLGIDDFGTGYSSLGYLKRFPVDTVKIDRSFVDGLASDPGDAAIVSAVIGLAHALGLRSIAEGVETEEQLAALVALGCDEAQGYFFAPPQPVQDLRQLIGRTRTWRPPGARLMVPPSGLATLPRPAAPSA